MLLVGTVKHLHERVALTDGTKSFESGLAGLLGVLSARRKLYL